MTERHLRVGVDLEPVARFATADPRLFTEAELTQTGAQAEPGEARAGRWCAKEAAVKALSSRRLLSPRDVEVLCDPSGRPHARVLADGFADVEFDVSISHSAGFAMAVAIALVAAEDPSRGVAR